jgi:hypothetical protein
LAEMAHLRIVTHAEASTFLAEHSKAKNNGSLRITEVC